MLANEKTLKTLELLVMLSRSRQHFPHGLTEEAKAGGQGLEPR